MKSIIFSLQQNENGAYVVVARNTITDETTILYTSVIYTHARLKFYEIQEFFEEHIK